MARQLIQPLRDDLMVQQQLKGPHKVWKHMVAVIMLNQTGRKPVKRAFPEFMHYWPSPERFLEGDEKIIRQVIAPLGMVNVRYNRLTRMTEDYLTWDKKDAKMLYGIGKYGSDSYEIFFKHNYHVEPTDKELIRYLQSLERSFSSIESLELA